jgi:DUF4097 and DUF4098 domain-containing protein YvlB
MHRICVVVAVLAFAAPAAAQDAQSIADIVNEALREARVEFAAAMAQVNRQAGQAGRAAAQAAREAERRRRDEARRGPEVTEAFSRTVKLGRDGTFSLENVSGDIEVTGSGGSDVRIDATKRARHNDPAEAKAILQDLVITVSERGGNVDVRTEYQRYSPRQRYRNGYTASVDYTVTVPREASVMLKSISGAVKVTNVNGELRAESVSGGIVATAARKLRTLKSISGDVEISDSQSDDLTAGTVSGSVIIRNVKTRIVELQSVSGDLHVTDVDADHAEMKTVSGNVEYAGRLSKSGRYEFQSHSGNVRLIPMGTPNFSIEATTFSGGVRTDFPLTLQGSPQSVARGFRRQNQSVRGTVGSGGAMITMQSFSGNIVIAKQ